MTRQLFNYGQTETDWLTRQGIFQEPRFLCLRYETCKATVFSSLTMAACRSAVSKETSDVEWSHIKQFIIQKKVVDSQTKDSCLVQPWS